MAPARVLNPQLIPIVGTDAHLPPVPHHALQPALLRQRFGRPLRWQPELPGDGPPGDGPPGDGPPGGAPSPQQRAPAQAAVLVPLVQREDLGDGGLRVLLTRRTEHLRDHAGQISFPGGRVEPGDADAVHTALREAQEEVGLPPQRVSVIGQMPVYTTITRFQVTPVVALVHPPFELALDSFEVAEAFEVPLAWLMNPAHHQRHVFTFDGGQRQFLSMHWQGCDAQGQARDYFIWGATAAMLRNLYRFLVGPAV